MKYWFDTEFIEDGKTIDLMSIGIVAEDGRSYYAEAEECEPSRASDWVKQNVISHLEGGDRRIPRDRIAVEVREFLGEKPELWAYYASYDWVALSQLYGTLMDLPKGWPKYCRDLKQWCDMLGSPALPEQTSTEHHALCDAIWTKQAWEWLRDHQRRNSEAV